MECNNELAEELLTMPKLIIDNNGVKENYFIKFGTGVIYERLNMCSLDKKWKFLISIRQNKIRTAKISIHFQENDNFIQLFRIDYNAPNHNNPKIAPEYLPECLLPYVGKEISENHAHIFVQNEKPLVWAIPLIDYEFPVKKILNIEDLCYALREFLKMVNLKTNCEIERRLIL